MTNESMLMEMLILIEESMRHKLIEMNRPMSQFPNEIDACAIATILAAGELAIENHTTDSVFWDVEKQCIEKFENYSLWKNNDRKKFVHDLTKLGIKFRQYIPEHHKIVGRFQCFMRKNNNTIHLHGSHMYVFEDKKSLFQDASKIAIDDWDVMLVEFPLGTLTGYSYSESLNIWVAEKDGTNPDNIRFDETALQYVGYEG